MSTLRPVYQEMGAYTTAECDRLGDVTLRKSSLEIGAGATRVVAGDCRIAGLRLGDAMMLELGPDGRITRIRPHLRPWLSLSVFALVIAPKLLPHPGVLWRALRAG